MTRTGGAARLIWCFGPDQDLVACNSSSGSGALGLSVSAQMQFFHHIIVEFVVECIEVGLRSDSGGEGKTFSSSPVEWRRSGVWASGRLRIAIRATCTGVTTTRRALRMEK